MPPQAMRAPGPPGRAADYSGRVAQHVAAKATIADTATDRQAPLV